MTWFICDMDDGVLRLEPTKRAAVDWFRHWTGTAKVTVLRYGPGRYELQEQYEKDGDTRTTVFLVGPGADPQGWDLAQRPLYPLDDDPYERIEREGSGRYAPDPQPEADNRLRGKVLITYPGTADREGYVIEDNGGRRVKVRWYSEYRYAGGGRGPRRMLVSPQVHEQWFPRKRLRQR